jgi:hypothetical protein
LTTVRIVGVSSLWSGFGNDDRAGLVLTHMEDARDDDLGFGDAVVDPVALHEHDTAAWKEIVPRDAALRIPD